MKGPESRLPVFSGRAYCGAESARQAKERQQGRVRRVLMTHPPYWGEANLEGPISGFVRLQICGLLRQFCRDLQSDLVDVAMSPV